MADVDNIFHFFAVQDVTYLVDRVRDGDAEDLRARARTCDQTAAVLDRAAVDTDAAAARLLQTWAGEAADAARRALALASDHRVCQGEQLHRSSSAFSTLAAALEEVQRVGHQCEAQATAANQALLSVLDEAWNIANTANPVLGAASWVVEKTTGFDVEAAVSSFLVAALAPLKDRALGILQLMTEALQDYQGVLVEQSAVLRVMPGIFRLDAGPVDLPGDADLRRGALFTVVYGRDPATEGELLMARALDVQGSDGGNTQSSANVTVIRITPVPGAGVVHGAAFIAEDDVLNPVYLQSPRNHGDNRGFDPSAGPDQARMSFDIDYETGVVVVRQNASVTNAEQSITGFPSVGVEQDSAGRLRMRIEGTDPFADPIAGWAGTSVRADVVVDPHGGRAPAEVSGKVSQFPSWEVYQDRAGATGDPLLQQVEPTGDVEELAGTGPLFHVGRPTHDVGPDASVLDDWRVQHHPDQDGRSSLLAGIQNELGSPVGSKMTDDFYDFPLHDQPYPTIDSSGRLLLPTADEAR